MKKKVHSIYVSILTSFVVWLCTGCGSTVTATPPSVSLQGPSVGVQGPSVSTHGQRQVTQTTTPSTSVEERWIHLPVSIIYPTGGSRLNDENRALLREAQASLAHRADIIRIRVEGHSDGRGNATANERLAMDRAQGVVDFMVGELGLPRELFEIESYGESAPRTSGSSAADRVQNRRVEFSILVRRQASY